MLDKESCLEKLILAYSHSYSIYRDILLPDNCCVLAEYHDRTENYVLSKKAVVYAMENHEYTYFALFDHLDKASAEKLVQAVLADGLNRIDLKNDHMCSGISLIILSDSIDKSAVKFLQKFSYQKNFKFGLKGWCEMRIAAMDISSKQAFANRAGKTAKETLISNFLLK